MFEYLCGKGRFDNVVLVTTKWRRQPTYEENQQEWERERELKHKYWKGMIQLGSYVERYDGSPDSACRILTLLHNKPRMITAPQHSITHPHKAPDATSRAQAETGLSVRQEELLFSPRRSLWWSHIKWAGVILSALLAWLIAVLVDLAFFHALVGVSQVKEPDRKAKSILALTGTVGFLLTMVVLVRVPFPLQSS